MDVTAGGYCGRELRLQGCERRATLSLLSSSSAMNPNIIEAAIGGGVATGEGGRRGGGSGARGRRRPLPVLRGIGASPPCGPGGSDCSVGSGAVPAGTALTRCCPGAGVALVAAPLIVGAMGFTAAGISAGSIAAKMMSAAAIANGGGVAAGSIVAVLQSIGECGAAGGWGDELISLPPSGSFTQKVGGWEKASAGEGTRSDKGPCALDVSGHREGRRGVGAPRLPPPSAHFGRSLSLQEPRGSLSLPKSGWPPSAGCSVR